MSSIIRPAVWAKIVAQARRYQQTVLSIGRAWIVTVLGSYFLISCLSQSVVLVPNDQIQLHLSLINVKSKKKRYCPLLPHHFFYMGPGVRHRAPLPPRHLHPTPPHPLSPTIDRCFRSKEIVKDYLSLWLFRMYCIHPFYICFSLIFFKKLNIWNGPSVVRTEHTYVGTSQTYHDSSRENSLLVLLKWSLSFLILAALNLPI